MSMIYLAGKYLNLDNVTEIIDGIDKVMMIEFVGGTRDYLAVESPEAAALRWYLNRISEDILDSYKIVQEREARYKRADDWHDRFKEFAAANGIKDELIVNSKGFSYNPFYSYRVFLQQNNPQEMWREPNQETYQEFLAQPAQDWNDRSIPF